MENQFSSKRRTLHLMELERRQWDLLVIGGGITGAGIALDAAARGMKTALIDMQDFAAGTSSRSTKLVHGGLRYLKQFEIGMVAEVGKERAVVYENGPHVTTPEPMLLPIYKGGTFGRWSTSFGLRLYDFLAGVKRGERRSMLNREAVLKKAPILKRDGLKGGGLYVEYRTDDARLCIEVVKKAVQLGAKAVNYVQAEELLYENGRLIGVHARDRAGGRSCTIKAKKIINAAGPWVDDLRKMDASRTGKSLRLTKGIHLVFDQSRFPLSQALYFDTPDGRMMFAIPRDGKTYIGTTDTDYTGDPANPDITPEDVEYVLSAANGMFPGLGLSHADVESGWAGLRPLIYEEGKSPSEISRKDEIFRSPSGMLTIAGGKLTGYRKMAETVTDIVARELAQEGASLFGPCTTRSIPVSGGDVGGSIGYPEFLDKMVLAGLHAGLARNDAEALARRYGSNTEQVLALLPETNEAANGFASKQLEPAKEAEDVPVRTVESEKASLPGRAAESEKADLSGGAVESEKTALFGGAGKPGSFGGVIRPSLPRHIHAALLYGIHNEAALKPADFLVRRSGMLLFDIYSARIWVDAVVEIMSRELSYSTDQALAYRKELEEEFAKVEAIRYYDKPELSL
ncbi:glycerol-3-phosphate dehydrogenase [Paenibacillus oryzae]|uniref:Glycerol-3-phosphate dehydrogenase n=1 Tax=Paenibacillus oryzae TaxID=1844972 RepID=A0A1A5YCQ1_9BACL|nr:glycerol-3-phosphate dehydrogenase/oxidase [Paenibacillus oryzae]OBR63175.1 glycerol-3-phosphate dehydrogenase [Paenibacillus oryzae]